MDMRNGSPPPCTGGLPRNRPDVNQLALFVLVAETRSFAGAARRLERTAPAVSQAMARLEELYGGDLFERRRGAPLRLTRIGEAILPSARQVMDLIDRQIVRAAETALSKAGYLNFGFSAGLAAGPLRAGIADFSARNGDIRLRLVEGAPAELNEQLHTRALDMIVVAMTSDSEDAGFAQEHLWDERLVAAMPSTHMLAGREQLSWRDLAQIPLLLRTSQHDARAFRALRNCMGEYRIDCEQHDVSRESLLEMVTMGVGLTLVPESAVVPHDGIAFVPLEEENARVEVKAIWPRADANPIRYRLLSHIRQSRPGSPPLDRQEQEARG